MMKNHPRCIIVFALNSIFIVIFIILLLSCSMDVQGFRPLKYQPPPSKSMNKSFAAEAYSGPSYGGIGHK
uniref:Transmembrane protein n=1 Tax=Quercus lobata TaxID=97700 RepID=A0A7N2KRI6_QUELO